MFLYIARHGESNGNTGADNTVDPLLTPRGEAQARSLGERLSKLGFDGIFASTLTRAIQTAAAVASRQPGEPAKIELLPDLVECGTEPGWRGKPENELLKVYPGLVFCPDPTPTGGPARAEAEEEAGQLARAYRVVSYIRRRFNPDSEAKVLCVAHGGFNQKLLSAAMNWGAVSGAIYSQNNACLNLVQFFRGGSGEERVRLCYSNDISHLAAENLDYRD